MYADVSAQFTCDLSLLSFLALLQKCIKVVMKRFDWVFTWSILERVTKTVAFLWSVRRELHSSHSALVHICAILSVVQCAGSGRQRRWLRAPV